MGGGRTERKPPRDPQPNPPRAALTILPTRCRSAGCTALTLPFGGSRSSHVAWGVGGGVSAPRRAAGPPRPPPLPAHVLRPHSGDRQERNAAVTQRGQREAQRHVPHREAAQILHLGGGGGGGTREVRPPHTHRPPPPPPPPRYLHGGPEFGAGAVREGAVRAHLVAVQGGLAAGAQSGGGGGGPADPPLIPRTAPPPSQPQSRRFTWTGIGRVRSGWGRRAAPRCPTASRWVRCCRCGVGGGGH